jgi:hypothetical protein
MVETTSIGRQIILNGLIASTAKAYDLRVPASAGIGCSNLIGIGAAAPFSDTGAFFAPAIINGGRRWATARLAGSYSRFATPTSSATIAVASEVVDSNLLNRSPRHGD